MVSPFNMVRGFQDRVFVCVCPFLCVDRNLQGRGCLLLSGTAASDYHRGPGQDPLSKWSWPIYRMTAAEFASLLMCSPEAIVRSFVDDRDLLPRLMQLTGRIPRQIAFYLRQVANDNRSSPLSELLSKYANMRWKGFECEQQIDCISLKKVCFSS